MGLRLRLHWFDKKTELGVDHEYSSDCGDDNSLLERLGISAANNINNGDFDVETHWIPLIQPLFYHWINPEDYDYQLAFEYKANWNSKDNIKKGHKMMTEQYISIDELVGIPFPYPLADPPKGWFACHGQAFDKEKYPKLAKCYPDGKLPDLRGEFIRGWDAGKGIDSERTILSEQQGTRLPNIFVYAHSATEGRLVTPPISEYGEKYPTMKSVDNAESIERGKGAYYSTSLTPYGNSSLSTFCVRPRNIAFNYIVKAA